MPKSATPLKAIPAGRILAKTAPLQYGRSDGSNGLAMQVQIKQGLQLLIIELLKTCGDLLADTSCCGRGSNLQEVLVAGLRAGLRPILGFEIRRGNQRRLLHKKASGGEGEAIALSHRLSPPKLIPHTREL